MVIIITESADVHAVSPANIAIRDEENHDTHFEIVVSLQRKRTTKFACFGYPKHFLSLPEANLPVILDMKVLKAI